MSHLKVEVLRPCSDSPSGIFAKILIFNWNRSTGLQEGKELLGEELGNKFQLPRITDIFIDTENTFCRDSEKHLLI